MSEIAQLFQIVNEMNGALGRVCGTVDSIKSQQEQSIEDRTQFQKEIKEEFEKGSKKFNEQDGRIASLETSRSNQKSVVAAGVGLSGFVAWIVGLIK